MKSFWLLHQCFDFLKLLKTIFWRKKRKGRIRKLIRIRNTVIDSCSLNESWELPEINRPLEEEDPAQVECPQDVVERTVVQEGDGHQQLDCSTDEQLQLGERNYFILTSDKSEILN